VYAESNIPEPQEGLQGPPPALQMPEVRVDAPAPERPKTMVDQYDELQQSRPEPIGGWRRPVNSFLRGGVAGLASELINPSREREVFKQKEDALLGGMKVQSQQRNNDLTEAYRNSQIEDTKSRQEDREERRRASGISQQEHIANNRWQELPSGMPTPLSTPGTDNQWEYATIDGKKYRRPSEAATQTSKREAEMATWREVPPTIAKELGLQAGTKVPAGELDGYLRMVESRAAREQSGNLRRELAHEAAETRKLVAGMVHGGGAGSATRQGQGGLSPTAQGVIDGKVLFHRLSAKEKSAVRDELLTKVPDWEEPNFDTAGERKSAAEGASAIAGLQELKTVLQDNSQYLGPIAGLQAYIPGSQAQKVRGSIDLIRQRVGKALEGGVLRKEDEKKYEKILGTITDRPDIAASKIDNVISELQRDMEIAAQERNRSGRTRPALGAPPPLTTPASTTAPVKMRGPDGREVMVKADKAAAAEARGWKRAN